MSILYYSYLAHSVHRYIGLCNLALRRVFAYITFKLPKMKYSTDAKS